MSKVSKIDQIHLRAVMLCMSKMSKMGKEHAYTFLLITFLTLIMPCITIVLLPVFCGIDTFFFFA